MLSLKVPLYERRGKADRNKTLHDGMGIFTYTPEEKPAVAKVTYKEKNINSIYRTPFPPDMY